MVVADRTFKLLPATWLGADGEVTCPGNAAIPGYNRNVEGITISISTCAETGTFVASWDDPRGFGGLTTQAENLSELERNIWEAVSVHFEPDDLPKHVRLHFVDDPVLAAA